MIPAFTSRGRLICSVSPFKLPRLERPYCPNPHGGMTAFELPIYTLADRDNQQPPKMLLFADSFQAQRDVWQGINYPGQHITPQFVSVDRIAEDIMKHWAVGRIGAPADSGPGVFLCTGQTPTDNEIAEGFRRQETYMAWLYEKALEFANNRLLIEISIDHRIAANWLKKDEVWSKTGAELAKDRCPLCQSLVMAEAYVCAACGHTIKAIPEEFAKLNPNKLGREAPGKPARA